MDDNDAGSPAAGEAPAAGPVTDAAASTPETTESQVDTEAEGQAEVDDSEDVDYEGKQYRLPKELKEALLRQTDYTQKTMSLADEKRAVAADKARVEQHARWNQDHAQEIGQLVSIDSRLQDYGKVDWQAWSRQDAAAASAAYIEYQQLKDARAGVVGSLQQRDAKMAEDASRERDRQLAEGRTRLAKEIPGWGDDMAKDVGQFAMSTYGYSADEVNATSDPRNVRVLRDAQLWRQHEAKQRAAARQVNPQVPAQPTPVVGTRRASPPISASSPASDKLDIETWNKRRDAEERQKRA